MKQLFYSEVLKKTFQTEEECLKAEKEFEEKHAAELKAKEEKAAKAKEIEQAYKHYIELRDAFVKEYGSYHMTYTKPETSLVDLFNNFWLL